MEEIYSNDIYINNMHALSSILQGTSGNVYKRQYSEIKKYIRDTDNCQIVNPLKIKVMNDLNTNFPRNANCRHLVFISNIWEKILKNPG